MCAENFIGPTCINPKGLKGTTFDQGPGFLLQVFHSLWRAQASAKYAIPKTRPSRLLISGTSASAVSGSKVPPRNAFRPLGAAIPEDEIDIRAENIFEIVAVALFQPEFVVMNDKETIHCWIIGVRRNHKKRPIFSQDCRISSFPTSLVQSRIQDAAHFGIAAVRQNRIGFVGQKRRGVPGQ